MKDVVKTIRQCSPPQRMLLEKSPKIYIPFLFKFSKSFFCLIHGFASTSNTACSALVSRDESQFPHYVHLIGVCRQCVSFGHRLVCVLCVRMQLFICTCMLYEWDCYACDCHRYLGFFSLTSLCLSADSVAYLAFCTFRLHNIFLLLCPAKNA